MTPSTDNYKKLARLFSSSMIRAAARFSIEKFEPYFELVDSLTSAGKPNSLTDLYETSFSLLAKKARTEYVYKNLLFSKLVFGKHSLNTSSMLTEFRVGNALADGVVINGESTCYEIKTEYDSVERLQRQLSEYRGYFDNIYVVISHKQFDLYLSKVPSDIGVLALTPRNQFKLVRESQVECRGYTPEMAATLLRAAELKKIVSTFDKSVYTVPNTELVEYCQSQLQSLSSDVIKRNSLSILKERGKLKNDFLSQLPSSLRAAGISVKLTLDQQRKLMINLDKII